MKLIFALMIAITSATSFAETNRFLKFKQTGILDSLTCIGIFKWGEPAQNNLYNVATQIQQTMNRLGFQNLDQIKHNKLALSALRETAAVELGKVNHLKDIKQSRGKLEMLIGTCQIFPQEFTAKYIARVKEHRSAIEQFSAGAIAN
jgi:hypothetical protein